MKYKKKSHKVSIVMGSKSDYKTMKNCEKVLKILKVNYETNIVSAHRTPDRLYAYAKKAENNNISIIIAGAGGSAHLPGMIAAITPEIIAITIHKIVCWVETTNSVKPWSSSAWIRLHAKNIPSPVPSIAPNTEMIEDSINTIFLICFLNVPIALIKPISLVLS